MMTTKKSLKEGWAREVKGYGGVVSLKQVGKTWCVVISIPFDEKGAREIYEKIGATYEIEVSDELYKKIKEQAKKEKISLDELVRRILEWRIRQLKRERELKRKRMKVKR